LLFSYRNICAAQNTPPEQTIVLHGEVLINGQPATLPMNLTVSVNGSPQTVPIKENFGITSYQVELASGDKAVQYTLLGDNIALTNSVSASSGDVTRIDLLHNTVLQTRPPLSSHSCSVSGDQWTVVCKVNPISDQGIDLATVSYRVGWYITTVETDPAVEPTTELLIEETVTNVTAEKESSLTATRAEADVDNHFLTVVVTPVLNDGTFGPSSVARVAPKLIAGEI
jgi:hypothetical protein